MDSYGLAVWMSSNLATVGRDEFHIFVSRKAYKTPQRVDRVAFSVYEEEPEGLSGGTSVVFARGPIA